MEERYALGATFSIHLAGRVAACRVFPRPELSTAAERESATDLAKLLRKLAFHDSADGVVLDLRRVPNVLDPFIEAQYGEALAAWESTAQPFAVLLVENALQKLQLKRMTTEHAPRFGAVFTDRMRAYVFAGAPPNDRTEGVGFRVSRVHSR